MLARLFLGFSLLGAEWVLYLLLVLSVVSVAIIFERILFYRQASQGIGEWRSRVRADASSGDLKTALEAARTRARSPGASSDLESQMAMALLANGRGPAEVLNEVAQDPVVRGRLAWEKNLSVLATIGSNAPFIGLFGTVLGIIKAFHHLSEQGSAGAQTVTAGIPEALVATAVGLLVAIPAVVASVDRALKANVVSMRYAVEASLRPTVTSALLAVAMSLLAALLAVIGVYGVVSYTVSQQQREFGVRLALGASRGSIVGMVLRDGAPVIGIGVAAGTLIAVGTFDDECCTAGVPAALASFGVKFTPRLWATAWSEASVMT